MKHSVLSNIVLIGASTGGPGQIHKIINSLPLLQNTSIIIAQHMVVGFMDSFAKRLQHNNINRVQVIENNRVLEPGCIYITEGETSLKRSTSGYTFHQKMSSTDGYNPDINILFNSFSLVPKETKILTIILTGIGDDGVGACQNLELNGSRCITETKESAIVDGMPSRARLVVPNIEVYEIDKIVKIISEYCE